MNTFSKVDKSGAGVIITAGGVSNRFGSNKLLEKLPNGKSVIITTIEKFLPFSNNIVIPCHEDVQEYIEKNLPNFSDKIYFAPFGETRQKSVFNGLLELEKQGGADTVLIHDGARPFIKAETINKTIEKLKEYKGVCVGVYATDTIKITDTTGKIIKTIDRNTVFCAQTPQGFDFKTILDAHKKLKDKDFTDDSGMLEYLGLEVYALQGSQTNKKITFREDLD